MSKCACGNAIGEPRVNPFPISYIPAVTQGKKKERVWLVYNGGMSTEGQCWFCAFPRREGWMNG